MIDHRTTIATAVSTLVVAGLLLAGTASVASAGVTASRTAGALAALEQEAGAPLRQRVSAATGLATFVAAPAGRSFPTGLSRQAPPERRARTFLDSHGTAFGISRASGLVLRRQPTLDRIGMEHVRLRQTWNGVPVTGGEISVHLSGDAVVAVTAKTIAGLADISTTPRLAAHEAAARARAELEGALGLTDFSVTEPRLELFNRGLLENRSTTTRLAWFVEARSLDLRQYVWIDAATGSVLLRFSQLAHARVREVFNAQDPLDGVYGDLPGVLACSEGDGPTGDLDIDLAFTYSGDTWDYFWSEHDRDSFDDAGATLTSTAHYCPSAASCPFDNAFWNGDQMVYGEGFPAADDVAAHEITHAVIEHTADLFYYMQSGALSESYADVFGESVDLVNGSGTDTAEVRWLLGEDRPCGDPAPGACATRSMTSPETFGDPAWVGDWRFVCEDPGDDGGGVHSNSGVPNHAFALLVDGGLFNGVTVDAIGLAKAGTIYYRALAHYLLSASSFIDHAEALRQSCQDLIGVASIDVTDCLAVEASVDAVQIDQPWPCERSAPTAKVLCTADAPASILFIDDFEGDPRGTWSASTPTSTPLGTNLWGWGHDFAASGVSHLRGDLLPHCNDSSSNLSTDSSVEMTTDVYVPPGGAYLQFAHAFGFENYSELEIPELYDGGVLEYSVDGGASWYDAGGLIIAGTAYGGTLETGFGNPLGGRQAFVADSWGYTATQAELLAVASQWVRFRFRIGTDESTDFCDYGWFVDDVQVFTCPSSCASLPVSGCLDCVPGLSLVTGGAVQTVETWVGCDSIHAGTDFGIGDAGRGTMIAPLVTFGNGFFLEASGELTVRTE